MQALYYGLLFNKYLASKFVIIIFSNYDTYFYFFAYELMQFMCMLITYKTRIHMDEIKINKYALNICIIYNLDY